MKSERTVARILFALIAVLGITMLSPGSSRAHCDGMDGPVVKAAQAAISTGDVNLVLIWVRQGDEAEIRRLFDQTLEVRKLGQQARELADRYFFETLVRLHRAGEGAPYTGLKPAGRDLGPAIPAADRALSSGDPAPLTDLLVERLRAGLAERYNQALAAKGYKPEDVEAGRKYVEKYVTLLHYVEGTSDVLARPVEHHDTGESDAPPHEH